MPQALSHSSCCWKCLSERLLISDRGAHHVLTATLLLPSAARVLFIFWLHALLNRIDNNIFRMISTLLLLLLLLLLLGV